MMMIYLELQIYHYEELYDDDSVIA